jgi:prepilin-type N-terminal cleavage/methylation domain-containing protein
MSQHKSQRGFTVIDLVITLAVMSILAGIATPGINRWMSSYRLKSASTDLFSNMQMAKMGSVKENRVWSMAFTGSGYQVLDGEGEVVRSIDFNQDYSGKIIYKNPEAGDTVDTDPLTFNPNGTTNVGWVYISNQDNTSYYRVGLQFASGGVRVERWNGSEWK